MAKKIERNGYYYYMDGVPYRRNKLRSTEKIPMHRRMRTANGSSIGATCDLRTAAENERFRDDGAFMYPPNLTTNHSN